MSEARWLAALLLAATATGEPLPLWPTTPAGETLRLPAGADPRGTVVSGRRTQVFAPDLEPFPAAQPGSPLILIFPGGGYNLLADDHEGTAVARRFQSLGCAAAVVRYRVPRRDPERPWQVPLLDARQALRLARERAAGWNADAAKVVAVGFSAGGNLVARLAYMPGSGPRPDFAVMVYPAYLLKGDKPGGALLTGPEGVVPAEGARPAPAFFVHSADDPYPAAGSLALASAIRSAGGAAETRLYPSGGHGWGVRGECPASREWPELVAAWLRGRGALR